VVSSVIVIYGGHSPCRLRCQLVLTPAGAIHASYIMPYIQRHTCHAPALLCCAYAMPLICCGQAMPYHYAPCHATRAHALPCHASRRRAAAMPCHAILRWRCHATRRHDVLCCAGVVLALAGVMLCCCAKAMLCWRAPCQRDVLC
jgi:hypothetical protein